MTDDVDPKRNAKRVTFHYIKSTDFRSLHVDGAIGSTAPSGLIHCAVYSERPAIPRVTSHAVDDDGALTDDDVEVVDGRTGYVRELQADLILTRDAALALAKFLNDLIIVEDDEDQERVLQ